MPDAPVTADPVVEPAGGLGLHPFRALRPAVDGDRLGRLLCPPYDVIDAAEKARLLAGDPHNIVSVVLPDPTPVGYDSAADALHSDVDTGLLRVDDAPALYVYEMRTPDGGVTRGFVGTVDLRAPEDGVILPHENTMAGPVADRLAVMTATDTDLEPIYLIYDGGGPASALLARIDHAPFAAQTSTPDGVRHTLWLVDGADDIAAVVEDLAQRRALIADGHHRYATYLERQRRRRTQDGPGPWDRGLALVVDSSQYGPQVHAIHRVVPGLTLAEASSRAAGLAQLSELAGPPADAVSSLPTGTGLRAVLTDGDRSLLIEDRDGRLSAAAAREGEPAALVALDVTVLHRGLVERAWGLTDDVEHVGYAHSVDDAIEAARRSGGIAVLLRPTPASAVAAVAAEGARMPRKSTLFTPKPASGLLMRRLADQT